MYGRLSFENHVDPKGRGQVIKQADIDLANGHRTGTNGSGAVYFWFFTGDNV